ncbi:MAG: hypothetical protein GY699_06930 [Desulfobacteraceae bacterium]|nr:hypothetical protein [Desulfobacteraceae bacterium]
MSAIEIIKGKLKKYPQLKYQVEGNKISVEPSLATGFSVWLIENDPGFTVGFDGWHEEFDSQDEALNCFGFGLSDECRLKIVMSDNMPCSWTVQSKNGDEWQDDSTTGLFLIPFWKKKKVKYLSNPIIMKSKQPAS